MYCKLQWGNEGLPHIQDPKVVYYQYQLCCRVKVGYSSFHCATAMKQPCYSSLQGLLVVPVTGTGGPLLYCCTRTLQIYTKFDIKIENGGSCLLAECQLSDIQKMLTILCNMLHHQDSDLFQKKKLYVIWYNIIFNQGKRSIIIVRERIFGHQYQENRNGYDRLSYERSYYSSYQGFIQ